MGISIIDKDADFSALAVGFNGLYTSVNDGLDALHDLRDSERRAVDNAVTDEITAYKVGSPVFSQESVAVTKESTIDFGIKPSGQRSIAIATKMRSGGASTDSLFSSAVTSNQVSGGDLLFNWNNTVAVNSYSYASASKPLTSPVNSIASLVISSPSPYELFVLTVEDGVGITLYHPRTATKNFKAATGFFATDNPLNYRLARVTGALGFDVAMVGIWSRPLLESEVNKFYADIKPQLNKSGVVI